MTVTDLALSAPEDAAEPSSAIASGGEAEEMEGLQGERRGNTEEGKVEGGKSTLNQFCANGWRKNSQRLQREKRAINYEDGHG